MDNTAKTGQPTMKGFKRKSHDLSELNLVKTRVLGPGETLPLVMEPGMNNLDLAEWAANSRALIESKLLHHGAILFRGFNLKTVADFERVALSLCPDLFGEYGDLPREGERVYASTPYPADQPILFHSESSHLPQWPMRQFFFSMIAAEQGGETPLLDNREVYRKLAPKIRDRFADKGLIYVRNFSGFDVSWQDFFRTTERAQVEKACREVGMDCEWTGGDNLRVRQRSRAVAKHPTTGEMVFFNQIQLHHVSCMDEKTRDSLRSLFKEEDLPRNVYYGDGTPIEDEVVAAVTELSWQTAKMLPWLVGDVIMLDNMLVAHARMPFTGQRKIVVAMGEMIKDKDLS
jgi:alpha-ketoglutarate-dependent taurine dioxygenase